MSDTELQLPQQDLRVALVQEATIWHDAAANRELYGKRVRQAVADAPRQPDLVVLPETFFSGFSNDILGQAESMEGPGVRWLRALAQELDVVITGSAVIAEHGQVYNRLLWANPDGSLLHYDKRHLFRMAGEHERYAAGQDKLIVELKGWRICPQVCYDLRFPVWLRNSYNRSITDRFDYDLLLFVANWPAPRRYAWQTLLRARAIENLAYVIGVNRVGIDGNQLAYAGDSAVLDFVGAPVVEAQDQPSILHATLSAEQLLAHRTRFPAWRDADAFELLG